MFIIIIIVIIVFIVIIIIVLIIIIIIVIVIIIIVIIIIVIIVVVIVIIIVWVYDEFRRDLCYFNSPMLWPHSRDAPPHKTQDLSALLPAVSSNRGAKLLCQMFCWVNCFQALRHYMKYTDIVLIL